MSSDAVASPIAPARLLPAAVVRCARLGRQEGPLLLAVAVFAAAVAAFTPLVQLTQDGWLTLLGGREILHHGLYARDSLTILTRGQDWVDQQWLAQVLFYGFARTGGVKLAMLVHFGLVVGAFGFAMAAARRRGAPVLAVAWVAAPLMLLVILGAAMRSQNFAYPLFVAVLALLVLDRGALSPRVFLALPVLVVWANLHGSVLLGALLVCLYAATHAAGALRRGAERGALLGCGALAAGAIGSVFATPYGSSIVGYYRSILGNTDMRLVAEWRPITDFGRAWMFFVVLGIGALLVARSRKRLQPFEILALIVTAAAAFHALRNVVWFAYAAMVILPVAATSMRSGHPRQPVKPPLALFAPLALCVLVVITATALARSDTWYQQEWSPAAAARVSAEVRSHPGATVWATERFADWLLWKEPSLAGRVAYDARLELLGHSDFRDIARFSTAAGRGWRAVVEPYDVVVLDTTENRRQIAALRGLSRRPTLYRDRFVTVLGAGRSASSSPVAVSPSGRGRAAPDRD